VSVREETIIVGSSLHALLLSYHKDVPIVLSDFKVPSLDVRFSSPLEIENISFNRHSDCWQFLKFVVSQKGLLRNNSSPDYVRVEDKIYFNSSARKLSLEYEECLLFSDSKIKCVNGIKKTINSGLYKVLDFVKISHCDVSKLDTIYPEDTHIEKILFEGPRNALCISLLNFQQLLDFDYSDTMSRFILEKQLKSLNVETAPATKDGKYRRKPLLIVTSRQVEDIEKTIFHDSEKIKNYGYDDEKRIEQAYRRDCPSI